MGEQVFNLEEAESLLPQLERWLRVVVEGQKQLAAHEQSYARLIENILLMGGRLVDVEQFANRKQEKRQWTARLRQVAQEIGNCGCVLKDWEMGLVDFPWRLGDREVYLCW